MNTTKAMMSHRMISKITALCLSAAIIFSPIVRADSVTAVTKDMNQAAGREFSGNLPIMIPQEFGIVKDKFISQSSQTHPLVVHIQDAHANYEAQLNIKAIIDYLNKTYGFSLVMLEGGFDKLEPARLQIFNEASSNADMVDLLVKKGEVTGAEAFLISKAYEGQNQNVASYGLESKQAYFTDLEHFRKIWSSTEQGREFASNLASQVDRAGSRIMNRKLNSFLKEWMRYREFKHSLNSYLATLQKISLEELKLNLDNPINQREWPILLRLFKLKSMEPELKLEKARSEWKKVKQDLLAKKMDTLVLDEIEKRLIGKKNGVSSQPISTRSLFVKWLQDSIPLGFSLSDYPQLAIWVGATLLRNEISSEETFQEIDRLNALILDRFSETEKEKQMVELIRTSFLLRDLFSLELSRDNYEKLAAAPNFFKPSVLIEKISALDSQTQIPDSAELTWMDNLFQECLRSYEFALAREDAFITNLENALQNSKNNRAVTVAGGFHTEGMTQRLKEKNISYIVVSPRITRFDQLNKERDNYIQSLIQNPKQATATSLRRNPSTLNAAGSFTDHTTYVSMQVASAVIDTANVNAVPLSDLNVAALQANHLSFAPDNAFLVIQAPNGVRAASIPIPVNVRNLTGQTSANVSALPAAAIQPQSLRDRVLSSRTVADGAAKLAGPVTDFLFQLVGFAPRVETTNIAATPTLPPTAVPAQKPGEPLQVNQPSSVTQSVLAARPERLIEVNLDTSDVLQAQVAQVSGGILPLDTAANNAEFVTALAGINVITPDQVEAAQITNEQFAALVAAPIAESALPKVTSHSRSIHISSTSNTDDLVRQFEYHLRIAAEVPTYSVSLIVLDASDGTIADLQKVFLARLNKLRRDRNSSASDANPKQVVVRSASASTISSVVSGIVSADTDKDVASRTAITADNLVSLTGIGRGNVRIVNDAPHTPEGRAAFATLIFSIVVGTRNIGTDRVYFASALEAFTQLLKIANEGKLAIMRAA